MPTVGCEADAVAFVEEERIASLETKEGHGQAYAADGSWSTPADFESADRSSIMLLVLLPIQHAGVARLRMKEVAIPASF